MIQLVFTSFLLAFCAIAQAQDVFINEVLTQNKALVKNYDGKSFDYIELYNASNKTIDISGYYLSDNKDTLKMYMLPKGTTIGAKQYLLVWANGNVSSKELNTNFKLKQKGETIYLSYANGTICHKLKYKRQFTNISYGLLPDGGNSKNYLIPTPKAANKTGRIFVSDLKGKSENNITITLNLNNYSVAVKNPSSEATSVKIIDNKTDKVLYRTKIESTAATIHFATYPAGKYELVIGKDTYRILKQ